MAQRFLSLEEAADQLGISKERLLELREHNKVTGYKDGASWKFRSEAIEKIAVEGIPSIEPPPSDLALDIDEEDHLELPSSYGKPAKKPAADLDEAEDSELSLADDDDLGLAAEEAPAEPAPAPAEEAAAAPAAESDLSLDDEVMVAGPASDLSLEDVDEPTVAGLDDDGSDDALALDHDDSIDINTDSILLSEAELGESPGRPPSTIIGKGELDLDADLDLSPLDKGAGPASDVKLAGGSDLLPIGDDELDLPSPSGNFEGLEELEVDLEAESSRILAPEDVAKAQAAAKKKAAASSKKATGLSDLGLAPTASDPMIATSDIGVGKEGSSGTGLTGLSALELDDDDDQVLGDGSDVTLSGGSSGINIISPSDSGLALDEVPLDLSGSAPIGSSLDLGMGSSIISEDDVSLEPLAISVGPESKVGDFQLTPLGEDEGEDEKDSSQVIALDEISEEAGAPLGAGLSEAGMMTEDFGMGLSPGMGAAPAATLVPAGADTPFSLANVLALAGCVMLLGLCGMMTYDLLRNIWSWDGVARPNSLLLQVLNPFLGR
jgi:excisionase family DNA binding protein